MAAYLKKAEQAGKIIDSIMDEVKDHSSKDFILSNLLYLYNLGIRTAPRPTQSTVRQRAVEAAAKNQPAKISMVEKTGTGYKGTYTYKAIQIQVQSRTIEENDSDSDD